MAGYVALHLYAIAVGMTSAGVAASLHAILAGRPASHVPWDGGISGRIAWAGFALVAGPFILVKHSLACARQGATRSFVLRAAAALAWSLFSGVVLIDLLAAG